MAKIEPPKIDPRKFSELFKLLKEMVPHYTPEWDASDEKDSGVALLKIFSHLTENIINRLNQVPHKNFVAFLDMLGIKLLPAQSARAPLTFKLATGTEKEILIPERTQAATDKTEEHEELPFETEKNLWAIPSQLQKVISVDPKEDAIYLPPPGFLDGKEQSQSQMTYTIVSSPLASAKNFQLDHVTDLEKGDFLKIGDEKQTEYAIIAEISGTIITITDSLLYAYPVNTPVEKITKFHVFEAKNMQEHSVYIGHKDLFNVKSTAHFILTITHYEDTEAGVTPLKVSWEYWGEVKEEEGQDWRKFETIDRTNGLSKDGKIDLVKKIEGEIKEREINGLKSRWIRGILEEPLPVNVSRKLPEFDNIVFVVKSAGENLLPDQAFNNDIPLDITQPYAPFGKEPRMFNTFAIAAKEVFSKKGAEITLDVDVKLRGILGPPTAIEDDQKIRVFARGSYGRLMGVQIDLTAIGPKEPEWTDHGFPSNTKIASESTPGAVKYLLGGVPRTQPTSRQYPTLKHISVFARAENGHLVERVYNRNQWQWIDHGSPKEGVNVDFDPAVIDQEGLSVISVFVTGSDGNLHEFCRSPERMTGTWYDHTKPTGISLASSPYGAGYTTRTGIDPVTEVRVKIFVRGDSGQLCELDCKIGNNSDDQWKTDYGSPSSSVNVDSRPFAKVYYDDTINGGGYYAKVFVKGSDGNLWELDTKTPGQWESLGIPGGEKDIKVSSNPHGYILNPESTDITKENKHIFVKGTDNCLWERTDSEDWIPHQVPASSKLRFSPFILYLQREYHIFSTSYQNSITERVSDTEKIWNEYKDPNETALNPALSWEYWNNKGWVVLKGLKDRTANLLKDGQITFELPEDIEETEVAGQQNYWIRARIIGGDYGKETFALLKKSGETETQQLISTKDSIRPPIITSLTISYDLKTKTFPQKCLTYNNLEYIHQTDACKTEDKHFSPFVQLEDKARTLYLGFEKFFKGGPIKIFFAAKELPFTEQEKPKLEWSYRADNIWGELSYLDATEALIKADILELLMPSDFSGFSRFGNYLYWLKGALVEGEYEKSPLLSGIYPNTTWALQAETLKDEILGSSDGEPDQTFSFLKFPVLQGEEIRVRETLSEEEKQTLITSLGEETIFEVRDETGKVTEIWVLWSEVPDFFDSSETSRHYALDRATGTIQFGDAKNGMIPPAGDDNIKAFFYQAGGGAQGNVATGEIKTMKSAVAGVDKVSNPVAADGGADTATLDQMLEIGPAMISHRNRAATVEDFEWLAKQASWKVVKVRCLPNTNNRKQTEIGWVMVIIVPDSTEAKPFPSLELRRKVRKYLEAHCANTLTSANHVHVVGPSYLEIGVSVDLFVTSIDVASEVEREARKKLNAFFHPLTGGPEEKGWEFGRDVAASDIYVLLEEIEGVDHVENLQLSSQAWEFNLFSAYPDCPDYRDKCAPLRTLEPTPHDTIIEDIVEVKRDVLAANGKHTINLQLINGG